MFRGSGAHSLRTVVFGALHSPVEDEVSDSELDDEELDDDDVDEEVESEPVLSELVFVVSLPVLPFESEPVTALPFASEPVTALPFASEPTLALPFASEPTLALPFESEPAFEPPLDVVLEAVPEVEPALVFNPAPDSEPVDSDEVDDSELVSVEPMVASEVLEFEVELDEVDELLDAETAVVAVALPSTGVMMGLGCTAAAVTSRPPMLAVASQLRVDMPALMDAPVTRRRVSKLQ